MGDGTQPLDGILVVELARYLPGAYAGQHLLRLGARVVRLESPDGDPMRRLEPGWDAALRVGKESVVCDLATDARLAQALCSRADVVLEGFRPGVADRLGIGPESVPPSVVYCSLTGFGSSGRHRGRAGHDLNYLGWAGALEDTAPQPPPLPIADLAAGALSAVAEIVASLLQRTRTGEGAWLNVSLTHGSHELVAYRVEGDAAVARPLTGGLACYRAYGTADDRFVTVAALEPKFFRRLCEVVGRPDLAVRHGDPDQESLAGELAAVFATRPLADWLELCDGEDVCVGPVATRLEAHDDLGPWPASLADVPLGEHTEQWREELGLV